MRRNASSASKGSHRRQRRRILKETALIYPKIIMVIIMQPHRWDKTLRWREMDSNLWFPNRSAPVFRDSSPVSHDGLTVSRPGTESSNPSPSTAESATNRSSEFRLVKTPNPHGPRFHGMARRTEQIG